MGGAAVNESDPAFFKRPDFADVVLAIPEPTQSGLEAPILVAPKSVPKKQYEFSMNKLSLLGISLSLMILGALCFGLGITATLYYTQMPSKKEGPIIAPQTASSQNPQNFLSPTAQISAGQTQGADAVAISQPPAVAPGTESQKTAEDQDSGIVSKVLKAIGLQSVISMWAGQEAQAQVMTYLPAGPKALQPLMAPLAGKIAGQANVLAQQTVKSVGLAGPQSADSTAGAAPLGVAPGATQAFTLQLGLFSAKANAEELVGRLQSLHYPAVIVEKNDAALGVSYGVQSGTYPSYNDAIYAAQLFFKDHGISAMPLALAQAPQGTQGAPGAVTPLAPAIPSATGTAPPVVSPASLTPPAPPKGATHGTP